MKKADVVETFTLLQTDENTKKFFDADISARIPYRLHCCVYNFNREVWVEDDILYNYDLGGNCQTLKILNERGSCLMYYQIRPYLRPMSSMTEEERGQYMDFIEWSYNDYNGTTTTCINKERLHEYLNFIYSHHLDDNNFIEKGLALEAPEGMYEVQD